MAALSTAYLTLADHAKRLDPDGKTPDIVELLAQTNDILKYLSFKEGNLPTGTRTTVRTSLPTVSWRMANAGVASSKSTTTQQDEQCGNLEAFSQVDEMVAKLNGNTKSFRLSEAKSFVEAMNQEAIGTLIYGNAGLAPEEFTGLAARYGAISGATNSSNVISAGGSGSDNSSIYLVVAGDGCHGIFPKASKAGLSHEDMGKILIQNAGGVTGALMVGMVDHWKWELGLSVPDWRQVARICNIDISNLVGESAAADLTKLMIKATHRVWNLKAGTPFFMMNRTVAEFLDIQRRSDVISGGGLDYENVDGKRVMRFRGIPIAIVDQLTETEATVS